MKKKYFLKETVVLIMSLFMVLSTTIIVAENNIKNNEHTETLSFSNYASVKSIEGSEIFSQIRQTILTGIPTFGYYMTDDNIKASVSADGGITWLVSGSDLINTFLKRNFQNPPDKPETPTGSTEGELEVEYTFCTSTTDPEGDLLFYLWDWDDGTNSDWLGPYSSGETACASHAWSNPGTYCIRVKAKDNYNNESDWSDPLCITINERILVEPLGQAVLTPIQDGYLVSNIGDSYNDGAQCTPEPAYNEFSLTLDLNDLILGAEISLDYFSLTDKFMYGIRVGNETRGVYPIRFIGISSGALSIIGWHMGNKIFEYQIQIGIPCGAFQVDEGVYSIIFNGSSSDSPSIIDWSKNNDKIITWKYDEESWVVDHIEIEHIDHDYPIGIGSCRAYGRYPQEIGNSGEFTIKHLQASNPPISDLKANGSLSWTDVKAGSIVEGSFSVENIGESESELRWELESYPDWGTWTLTPNCGNYLTPEDGQITVQVEVIAPNVTNQQFDGEIKIVNTENSDDFDIINIDLATTRNKGLNSQIYRLFFHFTNLFPILKILLQRLG